LKDGQHQPIFVKFDASKYEDNIRLFQTAYEKYGVVDHAIACAGIIEKGKWFDPGLTIESVEKPETLQTLDINFVGVAYFTRIAVVYLRQGRKEGEDKSIVLISSAAGIRDSPGLFIYQVGTQCECIMLLDMELNLCSAANMP
jgi:NAD(P)-dependent dehydrogenase (short-subunit alcohol dehydrogenase family)